MKEAFPFTFFFLFSALPIALSLSNLQRIATQRIYRVQLKKNDDWNKKKKKNNNNYTFSFLLLEKEPVALQ